MPILILAAGCQREERVQPEGALYKRYAQRPALNVAEVCGFNLNDSVQVDVVLLQAETDDAWRQLADELGVKDTAGSTSWLGETEEPSLRTTWNGQPLLRVIASPEKKAVGFYRLENEQQYDALLDYQINKLKNNK